MRTLLSAVALVAAVFVATSATAQPAASPAPGGPQAKVCFFYSGYIEEWLDKRVGPDRKSDARKAEYARVDRILKHQYVTNSCALLLTGSATGAVDLTPAVRQSIETGANPAAPARVVHAPAPGLCTVSVAAFRSGFAEQIAAINDTLKSVQASRGCRQTVDRVRSYRDTLNPALSLDDDVLRVHVRPKACAPQPGLVCARIGVRQRVRVEEDFGDVSTKVRFDARAGQKVRIRVDTNDPDIKVTDVGLADLAISGVAWLSPDTDKRNLVADYQLKHTGSYDFYVSGDGDPVTVTVLIEPLS